MRERDARGRRLNCGSIPERENGATGEQGIFLRTDLPATRWPTADISMNRSKSRTPAERSLRRGRVGNVRTVCGVHTFDGTSV